MNTIEKYLAVGSVFFISMATLGFLLISYLFDNKIRKKSDENIQFVSKQRNTMDFMIKANTAMKESFLLRDHVDLLKQFAQNKDLIQKKERTLRDVFKESAVYAINAAIETNVITAGQAEAEIRAC